jgi:hypothetical protein
LTLSIKIPVVIAVCVLLFSGPLSAQTKGKKPTPNLRENTPVPGKPGSLQEKNPVKPSLAESTPIPGSSNKYAPVTRMAAFIIRPYKLLVNAKKTEAAAPEFKPVKIPPFYAEAVDPDLIGMAARTYKSLVIKAEKDVAPQFKTVKIAPFDPLKVDPDRIRPTEKLAILPGTPNHRLADTTIQIIQNVTVVTFTIPRTKPPAPDPEPEMSSLAARNGTTPGVGGVNAPRLSKKKIPKPQRINLAESTPVPVRQAEAPKSTSSTIANTEPPKEEWNKAGLPVVYDTIRGRRLRPVPVEIYVSHKDTIYIYPADYEDPNVAKSEIPTAAYNSGSTVSQGQKEGFCNCMELVMIADDTIDFEDYVNYGFTFRNRCKEYVYLHSFSFKFNVYNTNGMPAKRIRRIDFVKRFDYPEFVRINPGDSYDYHFADDPFFEYDLNKGMEYKFTFMYNNFSNKYSASPSKTFLCSQPFDKVIYVR